MDVNHVAAREIRAEMGRQQLSQRKLAELLGWTSIYLWRRLREHVPFSLDDIEAIAGALHIPILQLTDPRSERGARA